MIKRILLMLLVAASAFLFSCKSGPEEGFKTYTDAKAGFSFEIPSDWSISYSEEQDAFICVSSDPVVAKRYADCFEGYIFRLEAHNQPLDSVLLPGDFYRKVDSTYVTSDRVSDSVRAELIRGDGWAGIYHVNVCGIMCQSTGFESATGSCEFLYFTNGNKTIAITTGGRALDPLLRKRIVSSFRIGN